MAYNEKIADRIRELFVDLPTVEEKEMMGGIAFLYNGKMCVGVIRDDLLCRIDPSMYEEALQKYGCRAMDFTGRTMNGWVFVEEEAIKTRKDFEYWINLALDFNKKAKKSKKK